jgi:hypothetical protein
MNLKRNNILKFLNRIVFVTALFAMLFQTTIHIFNFSIDASQDAISIELIEDIGEKELEEQADTEKIEWQSELQEVEPIAATKRAKTLNKLQINWAFSPENHSPPPEHL